MRYLISILFILAIGKINAQTIDTFPFSDDLETWSLCSEYCSNTCAISSDWTNVGNIDFRPDTAGTPSDSTGPNIDHSPGLSTGVYAYVESTDTCNLDTAILESPYIDLTNVVSPGFSFWYHQFTPDSISDTFDILVSTDSGSTWSVELTGQNNVPLDSWQFDSLGLGGFVGQIIKLRIRFITSGDSIDFAVDDFIFHGIQYLDAGLLGITASNGTCPGDTSSICVTLVNAGLLPLDTVTINTTLNGGALFSPYVFIGNLLPGNDTLICIGDTVFSNGDSIGAYSTMPNNIADTLNFNDTVAFIFAVGSSVTANAGNDTTVCYADTFQVGGSPTGPINTTFIWSPGSLFNDSTASNPFLALTQDTILIVSILDSITGCTDVDSISITVAANPAVDAGIDTVTVCQGDTVTIGGSPTAEAGNTVSWSPGLDLDDSTSFNPILTGDEIYFIFLTVIEPINGCSSTDAALIIANGTPNVEAGINSTICAGDSIELGGSPTTNLFGDIQWSGGGLMNFDTVPNPIATAQQDTFFVANVTTSLGCSSFDTIYLEVNDLPTAAISNSGACPNDTMQLIASGGVSYTWMTDSTINDTSISNPLAYPISNNYDYYVTVTGANGCADTAHINVSYYNNPNVDAGENDTICDGSAAQLQATGAINYVWTPTTGLDDPNIADPEASPTSSLEYFVNGIDGNGCSAVDSVIVFVNVLPTGDAGADEGVCLLDSVQLGGNPTGPAGATYLWPVAGIGQNTLSNPYFNSIGFAAGSYSYEVTVTDVNGCETTDEVEITVWDDPIAAIDPIASAICIGDSITISAQGGINYQWSPGGTIANATSQFTSAFPIVTTQYTVTVTDANGCTSTDQEDLVVFPLTQAEAGVDVDICQQDTITLDASGGVAYEWASSLFLESTNVPNPNAYPVQTTIFTVTVTDGNGCAETDDVAVSVKPLPNVSAGADKRSCLNQAIEIGGNPTGPNGSNYQWQPSASLDNSFASNPMATPTIDTKYYVTVTTAFGCQDSASMILVIDSLPVVNIEQEPEPICVGDTTSIIVTTGFSSYLWAPNLKISTTTGANVNVSPGTDKVYSVTVTNANGCLGEITVPVQVFNLPIVGISEDFEICEGDSFQLEATGGVIYQWTNGSTLKDSNSRITMAYPIESIRYEVAITDTNECKNTGRIVATVNPLPEVDAGQDIDNCDIDVVYIGGNPSGPSDAVFFWTPEIGLDDQFSPNPQVLNPERITYHLEVQDRNGCMGVDSVVVNADCYTLIYAPSAFTPGFNGLNDVFQLVHYRIVDPHLRIYNRLGALMFETNDLDEPWIGTEPNSNEILPAGVYYWILEYRTEDRKKGSKQGVVTLLK